MKQKFFKFTIWTLIFCFSFIGAIGSGVSAIKAKTLPTVQFVNSSSSGSEKISVQRFPVILSEKTDVEVTVDFKIVGGTAVAGVDYKPYNGTVHIKPGELMRNIPLYVYDDLKPGSNKSVVFMLSNPQNATLGWQSNYIFAILEDNMPVTSASVNPVNPNGNDNWYVTQPQVTLNRDRSGWTYYQWNTHDQGKWINYKGSITAPEGTNTLYFYSKDLPDALGGVKESLKSATFKVDTLKPNTPIVNVKLDSENHVNLSWSKISDAVKYEVYRAGSDFSLIASLNGDNTIYADSTVTSGSTYRYKVIATDAAGNQSFGNIVTIAIPAITTSSNVVTSTTQGKTFTKTVFKSIGTGVSTDISSTVTPQVQGVAEDLDNNSKDDTEKDGQNWNRIFLIIAILIIAAGVAIGGYFSYEWWLNHKEESNGDGKKKTKSRW